MEPAAAYNLHCSGQHDQLQEQLTGYHYSFSSSLLYPNDLINQNSTNYDLNMCSNGDAMGGGGVVSSRQGLMSSYCGGGDDDDAVLLQQYSSNFPSKLISHDEMILHNPNNNGLEESSQHYSMSQSKYHESQYQLNRTTTLGLSSDDDDHIRNSTTHRGQQQEYAACFSRILPSINISSSTSNYNSNSESDLCFFPNLVSNSSSSLDLNLQAKDHLMTYAYHHEHEVASNNSSQSSQNENTTLGRRHHHHHHHLMQQELIIKDSPSNNSNNNSFEDGVCKIKKRPNINISKSKNHVAAAEAKKQRSAPRLSCPPLKIRKEKLGDRIATLQRLVAPYGKTDTASVLTEAIGYIQFLHDQVQTLSVPYGLNKSSNNKPARTLHEEHKIGQEKKDLRSRGLCLVPLSSASFLHGYNTGI